LGVARLRTRHQLRPSPTLNRQAPLSTKFAPDGSNCKTTLLGGDSHDPAFKDRVARELAGTKVDFLFIDGDHTEAGVERDYRDYVGFVRPGGLVAFHDIVEKQPLPTNQVFGFWQRLRKEADVVEFVDNPKQCGFGIGVVRIPPDERQSRASTRFIRASSAVA
jgi:hypothetical protein